MNEENKQILIELNEIETKILNLIADTEDQQELNILLDNYEKVCKVKQKIASKEKFNANGAIRTIAFFTSALMPIFNMFTCYKFRYLKIR